MKVGVIGYGYWGPNVVRNLLGHPGAEVVIVADANPERLAEIRRIYPAIQTTLDATDVIRSSGIDAIVIATPVNTHYPLAKAALLAGKHVLVEKPLASNLAEAEELVKLAEEKHLVLMIDHTYLYSGAVQMIKKLIDSGELGQIQSFSSTRINLGLFQSDINVLWDLAPHDISILLYLIGQAPTMVNAVGASHTKNGIENIAYLTMRYDNGIIAHVNASWVSPVKIRQILIAGDKKMIVYDDNEPTEKIKVYETGYTVRTDEEKKRLYMDYRSGDIHIPKIESKEPLRLMVEDFVQAVTTGSTPVSNAAFGLQVVRILDAADRSIQKGGAEVQLISIPNTHMESVPFFDLKRQYAQLKPEIAPAIESVLEATAFSGGPFADKFDKEFSAYCGTAYSRGLNSGTSALHLALLALGIQPGDEVIVPAHTFIASAWGISYVGATPVFVDSLADTWEIDPAAVERAITSKTKAIIVVHLYGVPADLGALQKIASARNIQIIEDCAQAHGALYQGKKVGSIGAAGCFSFYPSKNLGAYGEAGAVTTNTEEVARRVEILRSHGAEVRYVHQTIGYNMRMDGIQGAVLSAKLPHLDSWNARKASIVAKYRKGIINPKVTLQAITAGATPAYHLFVVTTPNRQKFIDHLTSQGITTALHYPIPCHLQQAYAYLGYKKGDLPNAEHIAEHCVSLPLFPELTDHEVDRVIDAVNSYT